MTENTRTTTAPDTTTDPEIGMGATEVLPQDRYPYVVVGKATSGKTVWLKPLRTVSRATGHEPARECGGFPVRDHTYTEDELVALVEPTAELTRVTRRANGRWVKTGTRDVEFLFGHARYYRNYAD